MSTAWPAPEIGIWSTVRVPTAFAAPWPSSRPWCPAAVVMLMPWMVLFWARSMPWSPAVVTLMVGRAPVAFSMMMAGPPSGLVKRQRLVVAEQGLAVLKVDAFAGIGAGLDVDIVVEPGPLEALNS